MWQSVKMMYKWTTRFSQMAKTPALEKAQSKRLTLPIKLYKTTISTSSSMTLKMKKLLSKRARLKNRSRYLRMLAFWAKEEEKVKALKSGVASSLNKIAMVREEKSNLIM